MKLEELYQKALSDNELKKAFLDAANAGKLKEFLAANDCEATAEEAEELVIVKQKQTGELSDDELDKVSGGDCDTTYHNDRPVVSALNFCDFWSCETCHTSELSYGVIKDTCAVCGCLKICGNCEYSVYEDGLLLCYNSYRYYPEEYR